MLNYIKYPNPSFVRKTTTVINDYWQFSFDNSKWQTIRLPFCPESKLSTINYTDFIYRCYYKRTLNVSSLENNIVIHFGAIDYRCMLCVNGVCVAFHVGGYTPFVVDITPYLTVGDNELFLQVFDNEQCHVPTGKQSHKRNSFGCFYTRTTGIWQDVYLEVVPKEYVKSFKFYPNVNDASVDMDIVTNACGNLKVDVLFNNKIVGCFNGEIEYRKRITISLSESHLWTIGQGNIYDVVITFNNDVVYSYFGLRQVEYKGLDFLINGKKVFEKLVLDQGYYPDGVYTVADASELKRDIDLALELGFNGARLHQKVFDPRYLYYADVKGFIVWGEYSSWGVDYSTTDFVGRFLAEWSEAVNRDFNHPCIVTWCPLNETWGRLDDDREKRDVGFVDLVYSFTKYLDTTRPCVDVSGGHHGHKTDLYDFHTYEDVSSLKRYLDELDQNDTLNVKLLYCKGENMTYTPGLPVNLSEFGGICLTKQTVKSTATVNEGAVLSEDSWGYGNGETDGDAFVKRYCELIEVISKCKKLSGFCYTQLYDVEQEQNGFYTYERANKLTQRQKRIIKDINDSIE